MVENFFNFGLELGYLGIVLFSFISSVMVFIPIPYFPVLMSAALNKNFDPTPIVLFSTIGAVAGKMIIHFIGSRESDLFSLSVKVLSTSYLSQRL